MNILIVNSNKNESYEFYRYFIEKKREFKLIKNKKIQPLI